MNLDITDIVADDPSMSLDEWLLFLLVLRAAFGGMARLYTDAGYSNVALLLERNE